MTAIDASSANAREVVTALAKLRLEAIWIDDGVREGGAIELLIRDTPVNRKKVRAFAHAVGGALVPLSDQAHTVAIVGAMVAIDLVFGSARGTETFARVRAKAEHVVVGENSVLVWKRAVGT